MLRPIPSKSAGILAKKSQEIQPLEDGESARGNAEKLKLAATLHAQGINPERWTEAQPAGWAAQKAFQETGRKPDEPHFEVNGRLYKTSPRVAANQAQGQDALDVYLGAAPKAVEELVDIAKVKLIHPFSRPHEARDNRPDAHALNLHYARVGVDPKSAHNGDPLPMESQPKLQQATRGADGSEIPLGIPGIYRGYEDGFFYAANEGTAESAETQALRRKLAQEKATARGDAAAIAANDNDPEIDEAVARSYGKKVAEKPEQAAATQVISSNRSSTYTPEEAKIRLDTFASVIEKIQTGAALSENEQKVSEELIEAAKAMGQELDLKKIDLKAFKQDTSPIMAMLTADAATWPMLAEAGATGGSAVAGGMALPILGFASLPLAPLIIGRLLGIVPPPRENKLHMFSRAPYPDIATEERMLKNRRVALDGEATLAPELRPRPSSAGDQPPAGGIEGDQGAPTEPPPTDPNSWEDFAIAATVAGGTAAASEAAIRNTENDSASNKLPGAPTISAYQIGKGTENTSPKNLTAQEARTLINSGEIIEVAVGGVPMSIYAAKDGVDTKLKNIETLPQLKEALRECFPDAEISHIAGTGKKEMRMPDIQMSGAQNSMYPDMTFRVLMTDGSEFLVHYNTQTFNKLGPIPGEIRGISRHNANIEKILEAPNEGLHHKVPRGPSVIYGGPKRPDLSPQEYADWLATYMRAIVNCDDLIREVDRQKKKLAKPQKKETREIDTKEKIEKEDEVESGR